MAEIINTVAEPDDLTSIVRELRDLRERYAEMYGRIMFLRKLVPKGTNVRPMRGPCTRCGHTWRGRYVNILPRGCPRCGSTGWQLLPIYKNARRPGDPPNPKWQKNRKTGLPNDPENVLGRKTYVRPARKVKVTSSSQEFVSLTPPPMRITLVPPPRVRFAEEEAPQPETIASSSSPRSNEHLPDRVESDARVASKSGSEETPSRGHEAEEFPAVETDGLVTEEDNE